MTAAEYNHGYSAVLKNSLDWIYREWVRKPSRSSGTATGERARDRTASPGRRRASDGPVKQAVHLPLSVYLSMMKEARQSTPRSSRRSSKPRRRCAKISRGGQAPCVRPERG